MYSDKTYAFAAIVSALVVIGLLAWLVLGDVEITRTYWQR